MQRALLFRWSGCARTVPRPSSRQRQQQARPTIARSSNGVMQRDPVAVEAVATPTVPAVDFAPVTGPLQLQLAAETPRPVEPASKKVRQKRAVRKLPAEGPQVLQSRELPRVLILHTGGTLGMDAESSYTLDDEGQPVLKKGTGGSFKQRLRPGDMLSNLLQVVPELSVFADLELKVLFNKDSSRVGPSEWVQIAKFLHENRNLYDSFMVVHGTDTMAYTASALSLMLQGFKKPIVLTGSQLPLSMPRSDARQNLIDAITCATSRFSPPHHAHLQEVAVCFGGNLMRGNRAQKTNSTSYRAFESPTYPKLATLGIEVDWNTRYLLQVEGGYTPRFKLDSRVMRVPIVPGADPRMMYGDLYARGVRGIVLETFGVGNMPDMPTQGWIPWLKQQTKKGLQVHLSSQCTVAVLHPELYRSGSAALRFGADAGPQMTPECSVVKMMLCLAYPDLPLSTPLAGEI